MKSYCAKCPVLTTGFFSTLKGSSKNLAACLMTYGKYRRRQVLFQEGNSSRRLYALKSGLIKTLKAHSDGREQLISLIRPGEIFNLESLHGGNCSVTAEVLVESEICWLEGAQLFEMLARNNPMALEIIRLLSGSLAAAQERILDFGTRPAKARLAGFLSELVPAGARSSGGSLEIELPLSRREVGEMIGVSLETVSRLLLRLRQDRVAVSTRRRVRILDLPQLRALAR